MHFVSDLFRNIGLWFHGWLSGLLPGWAVTLIEYVLGVLILLTGALVTVLLLIWVERKIISRLQDRIGPNRVGPWGLLQTVADALKLLTKEDIIPEGAEKVSFNLAPILVVFPTIMVLGVIPFSRGIIGADLNIGVLYIVALGSIGVMATLMAGWSSNNKYALLGGFRVVAQLLSYEVPMVLAMLSAVLLAGTMSMQGLVEAQGGGFLNIPYWRIFVIPLGFLIYFIAALAELERTPFDLLEAESEIVAGFFIEYSGMKFAWFFLASYINTILLGAIAATLFLGGWQGPFVEHVPVLGVFYFAGKTLLMTILIFWIRGTFPRLRIDQLMGLAWKILVPLALIVLLLVAIVIKLPVPPLARQAVLFVSNIILLLGALGYIGRHLRLTAERQKLGGRL
ncbi:MAG: NADH-quinone oxidoreductase subunit NuoH [Anaerolineae bacterium]|nr:NADH-quinone oxidoreductase subunit NuoH [Anaerolineae bacterium]